MQVKYIKLSKFISSSKILNSNQMLISHFHPYITLCTNITFIYLSVFGVFFF